MDAVETAAWMISVGAEAKGTDYFGVTPLHLAARANGREIAQELTAKGADINAKDRGGRTPLHYAAEENAHETARWLISRGALLNGKDGSGNAPLHLAARQNAQETTELLVQNGADIEIRDNGERTPLHESVLTNSIRVARWLITLGAEINARDHLGKTPLDRALDLGDAALQNLLRESGGLTAQEKKRGRDRALLLADLGNRYVGRPFTANARQSDTGWTDVHYAALLNLSQVVVALIDDGASVDANLETGVAIIRTCCET